MNWRIQKRRLLLVGLLALALGILAGLAHADPPTPQLQATQVEMAPAVPSSVQILASLAGLDAREATGADDGSFDVGVEFIADAPPSGAGGGDLPGCRTSGWNFYNAMRAGGFTGGDNFI